MLYENADNKYGVLALGLCCFVALYVEDLSLSITFLCIGLVCWGVGTAHAASHWSTQFRAEFTEPLRP